jgi:hypothetical protein
MAERETPPDPPTPPSPSIDPTLPEPVRRFLQTGARLESIVLDAEGRWLHEGEVIENPRLRALFHRSIGRTSGGTWVLSIGPFTYPIQVEDTPYHVRSLRVEDEGEGGPRVMLRLSDDTEEALDPATLRLSQEEGRGLSCKVKGGAWEARLCRPAYLALAPRLVEGGGEDGGYALELGGRRFPLR